MGPYGHLTSSPCKGLAGTNFVHTQMLYTCEFCICMQKYGLVIVKYIFRGVFIFSTPRVVNCGKFGVETNSKNELSCI